MSAAVLTPSGNLGTVDDPIVVELPTPAENKFRILYHPDSNSRPSIGGLSELIHDEDVPPPTFSQELRNIEGLGDAQAEVQQEATTSNVPTTPTRSPVTTPASHPPFSRAVTMPVPTQLENPYRRLSSIHTTAKPSNDLVSSQFQDLSLELADSVQMIIQTMVQICPPQVLDLAKEQLASCALAIPTPSMSAIFTSLKSLNYMAANMHVFTREPGLEAFTNSPSTDFDIGELLQNAGDVLSGLSAAEGVELVLFHADVDLKHLWVRGDEPGLSYAISHVIRHILTTATRPGDSLEIGLQAKPPSRSRRDPSTMTSEAEETTQDDADDALQCTIEISHSYPLSDSSDPETPRTVANFSTPVLQKLLRKVGAQLVTDKSPSTRAFAARHTWEFVFTLPRGSPPPAAITASAEGGEPSLDQLKRFAAEDLRGKKVRLYASTQGSFAHHLTSYLTSWGMDVGHGLDLSAATGPVESPPTSPTGGPPPNGPNSSPKAAAKPVRLPPFTLIDDDVNVLRDRLDEIRWSMTPLKRPAMQRTASTHQIPRSASHPLPLTPSVIVYFTSLGNFKTVKDIVQTALSSVEAGSIVPEIMIIPKPAGPRRLLATLHSAVTKPVVDGFFNALSASPNTPSTSVLSNSPFFGTNGVTSSPPATSSKPSAMRLDSVQSTNGDEFTEEPVVAPARIPPSPLAITDSIATDYLEIPSEASSASTLAPVKETPVPLAQTKQLGVSPSSGFLTPQGIYFGVKGTKGSTPDAQLMLRESAAIPGMIRSPHSGRGPSGVYRADSYGSPRPEGSTKSRMSPSSDYFPRTSQSRRSSGANAETRNSAASPPPVSPASKAASTRRPTGKAQENLKAIPPISVLIVEDNTINQTILSTFMKRNKIKYDVANNGKEAVEKWQKGRFHLILMDIQMPIMDGMAATRQIRELEKQNAYAGFPPQTPMGLRTPSESRVTSSPFKSSVIIVALTASSMQQDRVDALAAGCNDFLTKPVSLKWLNNKIIEWGSIKALQMYGDTEQEILKSQVMKAQNVAEALQLPKPRSHTPSPGKTDVSTNDKPQRPSKSPLARPISQEGADTPRVSTFSEAAKVNGQNSADSGDDADAPTTDEEGRER